MARDNKKKAWNLKKKKKNEKEGRGQCGSSVETAEAEVLQLDT